MRGRPATADQRPRPSRGVGNPLRHQPFDGIWKPALVAADVIPPPEEPGKSARAPEDGMHALRRHYASVLLDAGENIKALSAYLGHSVKQAPPISYLRWSGAGLSPSASR